jgi:hypothetical protein
MKLLVPLLYSKSVLTPKSPKFYLNWKIQSLPTSTLKFSHAILQVLGSRGDNNLEWWMPLIVDNYATHSLADVGRGQSFGFSIFQLSNNIVAFQPPNVTSVVQPLD